MIIEILLIISTILMLMGQVNFNMGIIGFVFFTFFFILHAIKELKGEVERE